ncbi:MAG: FtsL-like putative cell division protein [Desulfonatronovibrionaceae bacterium]
MTVNILIILLIFLLFVIMIAFSARHLQTRKQNRIKKIREEQKNVQADFDNLKNNLLELTAQKNELENRLADARTKKTSAAQSEQEQKQTQKSAVDILKEKDIVSEAQIKKAQHYLDDNQPNMELEDVLVMFGYITPEQLKQAQNKD